MIHLRHNQAPYAAPLAPTPQDVVWYQRGTYFCAAVFALIVMFVLVRSFVYAPWFSIQTLTLRGDTQFHNGLTLRANVLPHLNGNYFTLNLRAVQNNFESLPWIRSAVIQRVFPNQLTIHLKAHEPVARWEGLSIEEESADSQSDTPAGIEAALDLERLVNQQGELFDASGGAIAMDDFPVLGGPDERVAEIWTTFQALSRLLQKQEMRLVRLTINPFETWQATVDGQAKLTLGKGSGTEVIARTERWLNHWPAVKHQYQSPVQLVDLRYPQGFSVRLAGVTTGIKAK